MHSEGRRRVVFHRRVCQIDDAERNLRQYRQRRAPSWAAPCTSTIFSPQQLGFNDPRYLITNKTPVTEKESALFDGTSFATHRLPLVNTTTSDVCEDYGSSSHLQGRPVRFPDYFPSEHDIKFPVGRVSRASNVTSLVIPEFGGRYAAVFDYEGSRRRHAHDTHGIRSSRSRRL